jgi:hypothetical protein
LAVLDRNSQAIELKYGQNMTNPNKVSGQHSEKIPKNIKILGCILKQTEGNHSKYGKNH